MSDALERAAKAHADEWRRWGYRRDKSARATEQWQVYRDLEPDGPITDTSISFEAKFPFSQLAEEACRTMRGHASARAAILAFLDGEDENMRRAVSESIRDAHGPLNIHWIRYADQARAALDALRAFLSTASQQGESK